MSKFVRMTKKFAFLHDKKGRLERRMARESVHPQQQIGTRSYFPLSCYWQGFIYTILLFTDLLLVNFTSMDDNGFSTVPRLQGALPCAETNATTTTVQHPEPESILFLIMMYQYLDYV